MAGRLSQSTSVFSKTSPSESSSTTSAKSCVGISENAADAQLAQHADGGLPDRLQHHLRR